MEPVSLVAALVAGAKVAAGAGITAGLTDAVKSGVTDAYAACKKAIRARFGDDDDAKEKLGQLEIKPDDAALQRALLAYVERHEVAGDSAVTRAAEELRVQLTRIEGGVGSISTGDITGNELSADRGGITAINLTGGATAGYTAAPSQPAQAPAAASASGPPGGDDPR